MLRGTWICLLLLLSGCAGAFVTKESPGRHDVGSSYSIQTAQAWSRYPGPPVSRTVDGMALGALRTWSSVEDGVSLFPQAPKKTPAFRADSTPIEVAELVSETIEISITGADVTVKDFKPIAFGAREGFSFEVHYSEEGLPMRGLAAGALHDGKLDLILFTAPAEYYFDHYAPKVERIIASVETRA